MEAGRPSRQDEAAVNRGRAARLVPARGGGVPWRVMTEVSLSVDALGLARRGQGQYPLE